MAKSRPWMVLCSWLTLMAVATAIDPSNVRSVADNNARTKSKSPSKEKSGPPRISTIDSESAHGLVRSHLPELRAVLQHLRDEDPVQYRRAVQDLARSARKLEAAKKRDERLYDIEVETLKAQNSVRLLTAKLKVRDNDDDRKQLRKATARLKMSELSRTEYEVDMFKARIERTQQLLRNAQERLDAKRDNMDDNLEKSYVQSLRKAGRAVDPKSTRNKSGKAGNPRPNNSRPAGSRPAGSNADSKSAKNGDQSDSAQSDKPAERKPPARAKRK